ncbi:MAG: PDZ domain-containing protein [Gemmatimonadaceae bacterium]|nr:PDZ domain-containing protein [Gemmatimonadaceae bacterium]
MAKPLVCNRWTFHGVVARWRPLAPALWLAAVALLAATPLVVEGQQRRVTVRGDARGTTRDVAREESPFEQEVDHLVQELLERKRLSMALLDNLQELQLALRSPNLTEQARSQGQVSLRRMRTQLAALENDGTRIQRRLSDICAAAKPEGWVGVIYSADASAFRDDEGGLVIRFVDYPEIESVDPGSPAEKAGIRGGDRILAMSGRDLRDAEIDFTPLLKVGTRIPFKLRRGMETKVLTVTVEPHPGEFASPCPWIDERIAAAFAPMQQLTFTITSDESAVPGSGPPRIVVQRRSLPAGATESPATPSLPTPVAATAPGAIAAPGPLPPVAGATSASTVVFAGAQFVAVGAELAAALGVVRGLLVVATGRGSPAERSGLRVGDVLLSVDGEALASPLTFLQAVEESRDRELRLQLVRRRKPVTATLKW